MGRTVSSELQDLLDRKSCNTQTTIDIIPLEADPIYVATDAFEANSNDYAADLLSCGPLEQSAGASTNRVQIRIQNVDKIFGAVVMAEDLVKAEAVMGRFFRDERTVGEDPDDGIWQELFRGEVLVAELNELEATLEIAHDLIAAGYCVCNWSLAENCQLPFKQADTCGYSGDETSCNKKRKSFDGCQGRGNEHRFGGMEFPDAQEPDAPAGGTGPFIPPGDWPGRGDPGGGDGGGGGGELPML